jgi:iron complex outermembrane receptor protein
MQHKKRIECLLASSALWMMALHPTGAMAAGQSAAPVAPAVQTEVADSSVVVVTANRVKTDAQKTAVSLAVYSGAALADAGVQNVQALQTIDPSINVTSSNGSAYVAIRGIASTDVTEIGDPSVPIARDGFFTNRSFSIASSMYDVQRIEVLKGPQGTLFGRNSTGGLINVITARPGEYRSGYLSVDAGNFGALNVEGAVNLPLSDKVQLRVSGVSRKHDGYRTLTGIGLKGDDERNRSGRVQLAFQPFAGFDGLVSYQKDKVDAVGDVNKVLPLGVVSPIGDARSFPNEALTLTELDGERVRWEFSYNRLPMGMTLTYAGGYDSQVFHHRLDATGPSYPAIRQFIQNESPDTRNHEVRLATPINNPLTAQVGYFYFTEKNVIDSGVYNVAMRPGTPGGNYSNTYGIKFDYRVNTRSDGLFGQIGYKLSDTWKVTAGARYSRDEKLRTGQAALNLGALVSPFINATPPATPGNGQMESSKPTFQLGADWSPTANNFVYAKFATGYKSGGFNSNGSSAALPYDEENVKSYELGTKNRIGGRKLQFNAAVFYQDYKGYQGSQATDALSSGGGVFNVGDATIKGVEAELIANVENVARFDVNTTLLQARFGDHILVRDGASPPVQHDIGGNDLPNAPRFVLTAGVERKFGVAGGTLTARLFGKHSSAFYYTVFNDADTRSPAVTTGNLLFTYHPAEGDWQGQAYVNNFTDEVVLANSQRNFVARINTMQFQPPRTFGVRMRYSF